MIHHSYLAVFKKDGHDMVVQIDGDDQAAKIAEDIDDYVLVLRQDVTLRDTLAITTGAAYLIDSVGNSYNVHPDGFDPITRVPRERV